MQCCLKYESSKLCQGKETSSEYHGKCSNPTNISKETKHASSSTSTCTSKKQYTYYQCHDCISGFTNYLIDNKSYLLSTNLSLKDAVKKADLEGYLIPDTRLKMLQGAADKKLDNSFTPTASHENNCDVGNLSEIENLDSPIMSRNEIVAEKPQNKIQPTQMEFITEINDSSPIDTCNNFEIDVREIYGELCKSNGCRLKSILREENASERVHKSKEDLTNLKIFSCIDDELDKRCMLEMKTTDSTELMFLQMMIEKFDEIAKVKKCSFKDVLTSFNKSDVNFSKLYGSLQSMGKK